MLDILKIAGFEPDPQSRLVRHQDDRYPVEVLRRHEWLELYQAYQRRPVFRDVNRIISFYGLTGTRAGFYGVYRIIDQRPARKGPTLTSCEWSQRWNRESKVFYELERDSRFDHLRDRLIIDWGRATQSWVQKLSNKPLLEIQEPGRRLPPFEDYLEFNLTYGQLKDLFVNETAHRDWSASLRAVAGIYLILAETCGDLYIGSAYGAEGIWGRWRTYATTGHGGNAKLRARMKRDPDYPAKFRFSILQVLPKTMARDEVLARESRYKQKLGTRAIGLNVN